ncbi:sigma 54-interacting transcriptional regulator [Nitratidesulfovibrio sp.]|uniref:sigma 54-interacting transcriptional regulator n=1 Tax=Nitratidesulfovibrio sp. TaxID=2802297 RepID=UPI00334094DC
MAKILLVDDEESIRFTLSAFLRRDGHVVVTAASLEEALHALEPANGGPPDLVITDIVLRGENGLDFARTVRERCPFVPVILLTGRPSVESAVRAVSEGAEQYLTKPVDKEQMLQAARTALRHKALDDERRALVIERENLRVHLEAVFQAVPDVLVTVTPDLRIQRMNRAARELPGGARDARQAAGRRFDEALGLFAPLFRPVLDETLGARRASRRRRVSAQLADGREQVFEIEAAPLVGGGGEFLGALLVARDVTRLAGLEEALGHRAGMNQIIGRSAPMSELFHLLDELAQTDTTVLITGESGTGKELVAEALHRGGPRALGPLVKVNCSALSEHLLESELFGHVRGAFTGAVRDRVGRFQLAHGGTIFLDEIGDVSSAVQLKLLRVLQEREFERVGDTRTVKVDVRVIAATNRPLAELVRSGRLREDLYYRLRVVELHLPALRDRRSDIPLLVDHFVEQFNIHFHRRMAGVTPAALQALMAHSWPGNVRELRHALEHGFILSRGDVIDVDALPPEVRTATGMSATVAPMPRSIACDTDLPPRAVGGGWAGEWARDREMDRSTDAMARFPHGAWSSGAPVHGPAAGAPAERAEVDHSGIYPDGTPVSLVGAGRGRGKASPASPGLGGSALPVMPTGLASGAYGGQVAEGHAPYGGDAGRRLRLTPELLADALRRAGNNKARAARLLGVSRQTVYRKLVEFGMPEGDPDGEPGGGASEGDASGP